jgi:signal transduction histidine kinase
MILSYFLVTLVAVLTVEVALTLAQMVRGYQRYSQATPLQVLLQKVQAPKVAPFLAQDTTDLQTLQNDVLVPLLNQTANYAGSSTSVVAVLDRDGQTLAAVSCDWTPLPEGNPVPQRVAAGDCNAASTQQVGTLLAPQAIRDAIRTAQTGGPKSVGVSGSGGNQSSLVLAVPVAAAGNESDPKGITPVVGELVVILQNPIFYELPITSESQSSFGSFLSEFLRRLDPAGFYFLLLAVIVGTLAGVLISRSLARRLRHIAQAADSWSRGEFEARVQDRSRDEIAELGRDLNSMAGQLETLLATRQELAVVEERNRLARELHDSVKQQVFANALLVRAARKILLRDPVAAEKHLTEAEELADEAQQGLVDLIQALRPTSVADKGLAVMLGEYANEWSKRMGIPVEVFIQGERTTPLDVEAALYRVAQESLANVARHSEAKQVSLRLEWDDAQLHLTITDDGKGFDAKKVGGSGNGNGKGMGLASMRERVEALNGTLTISSSPSGSVVQARVPLPSIVPANLASPTIPRREAAPVEPVEAGRHMTE